MKGESVGRIGKPLKDLRSQRYIDTKKYRMKVGGEIITKGLCDQMAGHIQDDKGVFNRNGKRNKDGDKNIREFIAYLEANVESNIY